MAGIKLYTYWGTWMSFNFNRNQLLSLKQHVKSGGDSTIRIGGYVFRCMEGHLYFANSGKPGKYYFDTPLSEILVLIDQAIAVEV